MIISGFPLGMIPSTLNIGQCLEILLLLTIGIHLGRGQRCYGTEQSPQPKITQLEMPKVRKWYQFRREKAWVQHEINIRR